MYTDCRTVLSLTLFGLKSMLHVADRLGKNLLIFLMLKKCQFLGSLQDEPVKGLFGSEILDNL